MARYIDADKMQDFLVETNDIDDWLEYEYNADWISSFIENQPTADVVEVKHGEWIKKFKYSHGYDDYYNTECSLCGYKAEKSGVGDKLFFDNFCPNCGADMRGVEK